MSVFQIVYTIKLYEHVNLLIKQYFGFMFKDIIIELIKIISKELLKTAFGQVIEQISKINHDTQKYTLEEYILIKYY